MTLEPFLIEAIETLGYVRPEAAPALAWLAENMPGQHPKAIGLAFRKVDPQIDLATKRAFGIRPNALMSETALEALTDKGRARPIDAFEVTLLRAWFGMVRARAVAVAEEHGAQIAVSGTFADCAGCQGWKGKQISPAEARKLPPSTCSHEACALLLEMRLDFFRGVTT